MNNTDRALDDYLDSILSANDDDKSLVTLTRRSLFGISLFAIIGGLMIGIAPVAQSNQSNNLLEESFIYEHTQALNNITIDPALYGLDLFQQTPDIPLFALDIPPPVY